MKYPKDFAALLKDLRVIEGLTQVQLAEILEVPKRTVQGWEYCYTLPSAENWQKIKKEFGNSKMFNMLEQGYMYCKRLSRV